MEDPYLALIENLKKSPLIGSSVQNAVQDASGSIVRTNRGTAMIMLSDDALATFEHDSEYKDYEVSNHMFADLLVPSSSKVKNPIIFWLAEHNPAGCKYHFVTIPIEHHVIQLGNSYSLDGVVASLAEALRFEKVKIVAAWFFREVENTVNKSIYDISPACKAVFFEIEPGIKETLSSIKHDLRVGRINWVLYDGRFPDLRVAAQILGLEKFIMGRTDARKTVLYRGADSIDAKELSFPEFIDEMMSPLGQWILFDVEAIYWGSNWMPLLNHMNNSPSNEGGMVVFIKEGLLAEAPFVDMVDQEQQPVFKL